MKRAYLVSSLTILFISYLYQTTRSMGFKICFVVRDKMPALIPLFKLIGIYPKTIIG